MVTFAELDTIAAEYWHPGGQPGLAFGVVRDGRLVHWGGFGQRFLGGPAPDADTVFRISSMTKSFTAAAVMLLRNDGQLALDDPAEEYVPEMRGWPPVTADSARVTLRHLLTMTAGFPVDDPWVDSLQGLLPEDFSALLTGGLGFAWAPDTKFEYASLGYAILGRIVAAVSGQAHPEFIRQRLLNPLGLTRTGFDAAEFAAENLALGYGHAPDGWAELQMASGGAYAPMGGVFSSVRDLSRWIAGFLGAFPPADEGAPHPLPPASRRQMQAPHTYYGSWPAFPTGAFPMFYGFGLYIDQDPELGLIVHHPGGCPGFGSQMRWHPATGTGVVAVANGSHATPYPLTVRLLAALVRLEKTSSAAKGQGLAPHGEPWPETVAARDAVNSLLQDWDDAEADQLFTSNVAQYVPYQARRRGIELVRERIGAFGDDPDRPPEYESPSRCRWWLTGQHGTVQVQIMLTAEKPPRVHWLSVAVPPSPGSPLAEALASVVGWINGGQPARVGERLDPVVALRRVRVAAAWAGTCHAGLCRSGDGTSAVTIELAGEHASLNLAVAVDPDTGLLHRLDLSGG